MFLGSLIYPQTTSFPNFTFPTGYTYNPIVTTRSRSEDSKKTLTPSLTEQESYVKSIFEEPLIRKPIRNDGSREGSRFYNYRQLANYGIANYGIAFDKLVIGKTYKEQEMDYNVGMIFSFSHTWFALGMEKPDQLTKESISEKDKNEKMSYVSEVSYGRVGLLIVEAYNHDNDYKQLYQAVKALIYQSSVSEANSWELLKDARLSYIYFNNKNEAQVLQSSPKEVMEAYKTDRINSENKTNVYPILFGLSSLDDMQEVNFKYNGKY